MEIQENIFSSDGLLESDIVVKNLVSEKTVAIEVLGPGHFKKYIDSDLVPTSCVAIGIKKTYQPVILVQVVEWSELRNDEEKKEYLKYLMKDFLVEENSK